MSKSLKPVITISTDGRTFDEIQEDFTGRVMEGKAVLCPCCSRHNMICKRKITSAMSRQLYRMWSEPDREFDGKDLQETTGGEWRMYSLLRHWGFAAVGVTEPELWSVTEDGKLFVEGKIDAPRFVYILNDRLIAWSPEKTNFKDTAKDWFDLSEVFSAESDIRGAEFVDDSDFV